MRDAEPDGLAKGLRALALKLRRGTKKEERPRSVYQILCKRDRATERGELMRYFMLELNKGRKRDGLDLLTMPRMGKIFELIPTKDLYYLKSVCDDSATRGFEFSKRFWFELKPREAVKGAGRIIVKIEKPKAKKKKSSTKKAG